MTDHGLKHSEAQALAIGAEVHFTNHPCRASVPVTVVGERGLIRFADGREFYAFADELSLSARDGLGQ